MAIPSSSFPPSSSHPGPPFTTSQLASDLPQRVMDSSFIFLSVSHGGDNGSHGANDSGAILKELENQEALQQLPVLLLLGAMAILGNIGNGVALYVYYTRFSASSTRTYIVAMSAFDLLFCSVTLPGEVLDLRFSLTYSASWLCRLHRLISISLTLVSALLLVAVALDRRRKICYPFLPQLTARQVSGSVLGCLMAALVLGFPFGVMNGRHSVRTSVQGVVGSACSVDDQFIDTSFPLVYNGLLLIIFIVCAVVMSVSYAQIGRKIVLHKRKRKRLQGRSTRLVGGVGSEGEGALMGTRHQPDTSDTLPQNSSHYDRSTDGDVSHPQPHPHSNSHHHHAQESKVDDEVFATDVVAVGENSRSPVPPKPEQKSKSESEPESKSESEPEPKSKSKSEPRTVSAQTTQRPEPSSSSSSSSPATEKPSVPKSAEKSTSSDGGAFFRSRSVRKREEDFEMAVRTLVHAVSEDVLLSSQLFSAQRICPFPNTTTSRPRSASVGEACPSSRRKDELSRLSPQLSKQRVTASSQQDEEASDVERYMTDVKRSLTSSSESAGHSHAKDGGEGESTNRNENALKGTEVKQGKHYERKPSFKHNDESQSTMGGVKKSVSLKSKNDDDVVNSVCHVTISESKSERLQSLLYHTLSRFRPGQRPSADDLASTSSLRRPHLGRGIPSRTTWMMFVLTAIFIISYLPYLSLVCVRAIDHDFETGLGGWQLNLYTLGLRSYFINSIVNPFVYSFCSARFRHQCRHIFRRRPKMSLSD